MKFRCFGSNWEGGVFLWVLLKVLAEAVVAVRWRSLTVEVPIDFGSSGLPRLQNAMLSKKNHGAIDSSVKGFNPLKKLFVAGIALGVATWMTPEVRAQACDTPGCKCQQGQHGHHHDCQAVTVLDRIDSFADRLETGLDRVFGRMISKKKHCNCAHCQGKTSGMAYANVPADVVPLVEPGIEPMSVPEEPGIADPLPIRTIEPNTKSGSSKTINPNTNSRPRVPMKAIEPTQITAPKQITAPEREFPTSTQQGSEVPFNVRPKQPAIELRPLETAPPSSKNKPNREPGVIIPEWLDDPFKEDQSSKESAKPQRLLPAAPTPPNDIRWSKRPSLEQQSQKVEAPKSETVVVSPAKPEPVVVNEPKPEPVLRLRISDQSAERAGGKISDRDEPNVVKASSNQPIRITFPVKK